MVGVKICCNPPIPYNIKWKSRWPKGFNPNSIFLSRFLHSFSIFFQNLNQVHASHKKANQVGINAEESLLIESASREAVLCDQISELEAELKHARGEVSVSICEINYKIILLIS